MKIALALPKAKINYKYNVEYSLKDGNGNIKPVFQENIFARLMMEEGRLSPHFVTDPKYKNWLWLFGSWQNKKIIKNLVTSAGKAAVASRINGSGGEAAFDRIALGIGTTAAAIGDTALESEIVDSGLARVLATLSRTTTTVTNDTAQWVTTFTATGSKAVTESGVLNAGAAGTLLCRQVFSAINVINNDQLQVTWKLSNA